MMLKLDLADRELRHLLNLFDKKEMEYHDPFLACWRKEKVKSDLIALKEQIDSWQIYRYEAQEQRLEVLKQLQKMQEDSQQRAIVAENRRRQQAIEAANRRQQELEAVLKQAEIDAIWKQEQLKIKVKLQVMDNIVWDIRNLFVAIPYNNGYDRYLDDLHRLFGEASEQGKIMLSASEVTTHFLAKMLEETKGMYQLIFLDVEISEASIFDETYCIGWKLKFQELDIAEHIIEEETTMVASKYLAVMTTDMLNQIPNQVEDDYLVIVWNVKISYKFLAKILMSNTRSRLKVWRRIEVSPLLNKSYLWKLEKESTRMDNWPTGIGTLLSFEDFCVFWNNIAAIFIIGTHGPVEGNMVCEISEEQHGVKEDYNKNYRLLATQAHYSEVILVGANDHAVAALTSGLFIWPTGIAVSHEFMVYVKIDNDTLVSSAAYSLGIDEDYVDKVFILMHGQPLMSNNEVVLKSRSYLLAIQLNEIICWRTGIGKFLHLHILFLCGQSDSLNFRCFIAPIILRMYLLQYVFHYEDIQLTYVMLDVETKCLFKGEDSTFILHKPVALFKHDDVMLLKDELKILEVNCFAIELHSSVSAMQIDGLLGWPTGIGNYYIFHRIFVCGRSSSCSTGIESIICDDIPLFLQNGRFRRIIYNIFIVVKCSEILIWGSYKYRNLEDSVESSGHLDYVITGMVLNFSSFLTDMVVKFHLLSCYLGIWKFMNGRCIRMYMYDLDLSLKFAVAVWSLPPNKLQFEYVIKSMGGLLSIEVMVIKEPDSLRQNPENEIINAHQLFAEMGQFEKFRVGGKDIGSSSYMSCTLIPAQNIDIKWVTGVAIHTRLGVSMTIFLKDTSEETIVIVIMVDNKGYNVVALRNVLSIAATKFKVMWNVCVQEVFVQKWEVILDLWFDCKFKSLNFIRSFGVIKEALSGYSDFLVFLNKLSTNGLVSSSIAVQDMNRGQSYFYIYDQHEIYASYLSKLGTEKVLQIAKYELLPWCMFSSVVQELYITLDFDAFVLLEVCEKIWNEDSLRIICAQIKSQVYDLRTRVSRVWLVISVYHLEAIHNDHYVVVENTGRPKSNRPPPDLAFWSLTIMPCKDYVGDSESLDVFLHGDRMEIFQPPSFENKVNYLLWDYATPNCFHKWVDDGCQLCMYQDLQPACFIVSFWIREDTNHLKGRAVIHVKMMMGSMMGSLNDMLWAFIVLAQVRNIYVAMLYYKMVAE